MKHKLKGNLFIMVIAILFVIVILWQIFSNKKDDTASAAMENQNEVESEDDSSTEPDNDVKNTNKEELKDESKIIKIDGKYYGKLQDELGVMASYMGDQSSFQSPKNYHDKIYQLAVFAMFELESCKVLDKDPQNRISSNELSNSNVYKIDLDDFEWMIARKFNLSGEIYDVLEDFDSEDVNADGWFGYVQDGFFYFCPVSQGGLVGVDLDFQVLNKNDYEVYVKCDFNDDASGQTEASIYAIASLKKEKKKVYWSFLEWSDEPIAYQADKADKTDKADPKKVSVNEKKLYAPIIRQMKSFFQGNLSVYDSKIINYLDNDVNGYQSELLLSSTYSMVFSLDSRGYCVWENDAYCDTYEIIYCYYDINKDGIDELLVGERTDYFGYMSPSIKDIWSVSDGNLIFLMNGDDNRPIYLTTDGKIYWTMDLSYDSHAIEILQLEASGELRLDYDLRQEADDVNADYLRYSENGNAINEEEYINRLQSIQQSMSLVDLQGLNWEILYKYR